MLDQLQSAITLNGGTPAQQSQIGALRELVTAYGGTPTKWSLNELLEEAITAVGGTPTRHSEVGLLRELVTALGDTPTEYTAAPLYDRLALLAAITPSEYYIDLEFTPPLYTLDGEAYSDIAQVPGYSYSDLTDNVPNINSDGYLSNTADQTDLRLDSPAIINESFTIFLVVEHLDAAGSTEFICSFKDGTTTNHITFARGSTDFATLSGSSGGVGFSTSHAMGTSSGLRGYAIRRNVGSNTWTLFSKNTDTTNDNSASGAAGVPAGIDQINVGSRLGSNRPDARIKLVQMRRELLTNAEVTAQLDGLWSGLS